MDQADLILLHVGLECARSEDDEVCVADISFSAVSLHDRSQHSWAVVGDDSGAIAIGADGNLMMRMREHHAREAAAAMTAVAVVGPTRH